MINGEKLAFFKDYLGNNQIVTINIHDKLRVLMRSYINDINTGYMNIYFHSENRLFLDVIYCYDKYRELGIASKLSELADFILKDYEGYLIRGVYSPSQLSTDRNKKIDYEILDNAARCFYEKNGYKIVKYTEYIDNKDMYPDLNELDFNLSEICPTTIVYKKLTKKEYAFYEDNGIIYQKNNNILKLSK